MLLLAAVAAFVSTLGDPPSNLPGVALGSEAVLYVERGAAVFVGELLALLVIWRAFEGRLPDKLSGRGVEYASRETADQVRALTTAGLEELTQADKVISERLERLEEVDRAIKERLTQADQVRALTTAGLEELTQADKVISERLERLERMVHENGDATARRSSS